MLWESKFAQINLNEGVEFFVAFFCWWTEPHPLVGGKAEKEEEETETFAIFT